MKKIGFQIFICLFAINLFAISGFAEILYVRPAGNKYGASDGSSYGNAWDGFSKIKWGGTQQNNGEVNAGDTLYICGVHKETLTINVSGLENKPIIIRGDYTIESGVIDGLNSIEHAIQAKRNRFIEFKSMELKNTSGTACYLYASGHENDLRNVKIEKFIINNAKKNGIALTGDNVTIKECTIFDIGDDGIYARGAYLQVIGCEIYNVAQKDLGDCIQLSTRGKNCYIAHNILKNLSDKAKQCIVIHGKDIGGVVEYNTCEISTSSNRSHFPIQIRQRQVDVRYNKFKGGNYCGVFFDGRIYYNIFQDATEVGVRVAADEVIGKVELYNNDILNCPTGLYHDSSVELIAKNNIFFNCSKYGIKILPDGKNTFMSARNCSYNNGINFFLIDKGNNIVDENPRFENYNDNNYHLMFNSPCVNNGVRIESIHSMHDITGILISEGTAPSIGAYQYVNRPLNFVVK